MASRRALALVLALAGAERTRAALARGVAWPALTTRHATHCATRRGSALRACDSCMLPSEEKDEDDEVLTFLGQSFSGSPLVVAQDLVLNALPVIVPVAAFNGYDEVLSFVTWLIDIGPGNWLAVDGGKEQVSLLQPPINGVILPAISIALGTLSATTISSLRDRQITLRECLHKEACLLDFLFSASGTVFGGRRRVEERRSALVLLQGYCSRVISESSQQLDMDRIITQGAVDSEIRTFIRLLHRSPPIRDSTDEHGAPLAFHEGALAGFTPGISSGSAALDARFDPERVDAAEPRFFDATSFNAQLASKEMMMVRAERLSLLQTTFPAIHWAVMCLLGGSIVLCFLLETDDKLLQFLDLSQLRIIFSFLVGALTGIFSICVDLNDPFRGSFRITQSAAQLYTLRDLIRAEAIEAAAQVKDEAMQTQARARLGQPRVP